MVDNEIWKRGLTPCWGLSLYVKAHECPVAKAFGDCNKNRELPKAQRRNRDVVP